jgi:hypothetical protein
VKILTSRTRVLRRTTHSLLILQPCGCKYWFHRKRRLCKHVVQRVRVKINQGWLQREIAQELLISQPTISNALAGKRRYQG